MLARGKPGMTEEQVKDFVSRWYPASLRLSFSMMAAAPTTGSSHMDLLMVASGSRTQLPVKSAMVVGKMSRSASQAWVL